MGTAGGIIASGKLTEYRLSQLEKKVDKQNSATSKIPIIEEKIVNLGRRISGLENERNHYGYFEN